ncbi:hypothetical protein ACFWDI_35590 [Streptomyces sp. NPDC060064]|uniref:hypothetical protein n=1 Tax=Streptomyces sp. NPDC060064 TaxID=3347049 RepID=UPI0036A8BDB8
MLDGVDAGIAAYEPATGPAAALQGLAAALRKARDAHCAEFITALLADSAASVLTLNGQLPLAVRVLAATDTWRSDSPRSVPEQTDADQIRSRARAELGIRRYENECAAGHALTVTQVIDLLQDTGEPEAVSGS